MSNSKIEKVLMLCEAHLLKDDFNLLVLTIQDQFLQ